LHGSFKIATNLQKTEQEKPLGLHIASVQPVRSIATFGYCLILVIGNLHSQTELPAMTRLK